MTPNDTVRAPTTSLERMRACFRGEPFDQYPFLVTYPQWSLLPWLPQLSGLTHLHLEYGTDEERLRCHAVVSEALGLDWMHLPVGPERAKKDRYRVEMQGTVPVLVDTVAQTRERFEHPPEVLQANQPSVTSLREVEQRPPPPSAETLLESGFYDITWEFARRHGSRNFLLTTTSGPFSHCYETLGFEALMDALGDKPGLLHALLEWKTEEIIQRAQALAHVGAHGLRVWEIFCGADLISQKAFREFVFPYNRMIFRALRAAGLVAIFELMGWVEPRLGQLADMEMDCLQSDCTLKGQPNRIAEYRKALGEEVCLFGNVNAVDVIEKGDEGVWRQAIMDQAQGVGEQRRYCICNGTPTTWATPPEKLARFGCRAREILAQICPPHSLTP